MTTIYAVYEQDDMVEGRGSYNFTCAFTTYKEAIKYMDYRPGIMGRRCKWSESKNKDYFIKEILIYNTAEEKDPNFINNYDEYKRTIEKEIEYEKRKKKKKIDTLKKQLQQI